MSTPAIVMMICTCLLVWGGFVSFLCAVWRIERRKARRDAGDDKEPRIPIPR